MLCELHLSHHTLIGHCKILQDPITVLTGQVLLAMKSAGVLPFNNNGSRIEPRVLVPADLHIAALESKVQTSGSI